jgi:hypothetical protein
VRFKSVLALTPTNSPIFGYARALRGRCDDFTEFNYEASLREVGIVETRKRISAIVEERKIEVFFLSLFGDNFLVPLEFLRELQKRTRIVLWRWDDEGDFDVHSRYYAQAADAVVTTDYFSVAAYRELGVPAILCFGSLTKEMFPAPDLTRDIDVSFVGNCRKTDRAGYLDFLAANGIRVESYGLGSPRGFIADSEMSRIFSRSKINLNFSRLEFPSARIMGHKVRPIEVAMTRSFCLSEYYPALPRVFEIGAEIDCFSDPHSLLEKVRHYLAREEERERIAARAQARALREYEDGPCFDRITDELAEIFSKRPAGSFRPPVLIKSPEFKRRQVGDLVLHGVALLRRGRLRAWADLAPEFLQYGPGTFLAGAAGGLARGFGLLGRKLAASFS